MAKKKLKKYIVNADESDVFAISVVDAPAVESEFIALAKDKEALYFKDEEKHMLYGCALRTDYPMYRNSEKFGEYYVEFSKESVEKMARRFMKAGYQNNWTEGHQKEAEGLTVVESWIKTDPYKDKSLALGFGEECAVGSWFVGCYVDSNDIWEKVKKGEYKGFSVEALCSLDELEFNKVNDMDMTNDETFWQRMKGLLKEVFTSDEVSTGHKDVFGQINEPEVNLVEENLEEQTPIVNEEPASPENPNDEVGETHVEEEVVETVEEPSKPDESGEEEPVEPEPNPLEDLVKNLQDELKALKEANAELQNKVKALGKKPSAKPVNTNAKPSAADTYAQWRSQMGKYINGGY